MRKAQSALEYLMTYGWVFIIIVIVGAALWALGVFNPQSETTSLTEQSFETDEVGVMDHRMVEGGAWEMILFPRGYDMRIINITVNNETTDYDTFISNGQSGVFSGNLSTVGELGDSYMYNMYISYVRLDSGFNHIAVGLFAGTIEAGNITYSTTPTQQTPGSFYQTSQVDFSQGTTSDTDISMTPGSVVLDLKSGWLSENFLYRRTVTFTEQSNNNLENYPAYFELDTQDLINNNKLNNDASDLRITVDNIEVPFQIEDGTLNTPNTTIWLLLNISASATKNIYIYYGNPSASAPSYSTDLQYSTGSDGHFENNKIYAHIGNNNNPNSWGFDSIYDKSVGRDIVNYYSFLFQRLSINPHSVTATETGPIYVELTMNGTGDERNNGPLVYRLYSNNNIIRWMYDGTINQNNSVWFGFDNSELNVFESNTETHTLTSSITNYSFYNIQYSYVREYNQTSNYSLVMLSPVRLNQSDVSGHNSNSIDEYMGLSINSPINVSWFDYYIGIIDNCNYLSDISINPPVFSIGSEEGKYVSNGIFTSNVHDTNYLSPDYDYLTFWEDNDAQTDVRVRIRSGSSETDCLTAPWYGPTNTSDYYDFNQVINNIHNGDRWIQYRIYLSTSNEGATPLFDAINMSYSQS